MNTARRRTKKTKVPKLVMASPTKRRRKKKVAKKPPPDFPKSFKEFIEIRLKTDEMTPKVCNSFLEESVSLINSWILSVKNLITEMKQTDLFAVQASKFKDEIIEELMQASLANLVHYMYSELNKQMEAITKVIKLHCKEERYLRKRFHEMNVNWAKGQLTSPFMNQKEDRDYGGSSQMGRFDTQLTLQEYFNKNLWDPAVDGVWKNEKLTGNEKLLKVIEQAMDMNNVTVGWKKRKDRIVDFNNNRVKKIKEGNGVTDEKAGFINQELYLKPKFMAILKARAHRARMRIRDRELAELRRIEAELLKAKKEADMRARYANRDNYLKAVVVKKTKEQLEHEKKYRHPNDRDLVKNLKLLRAYSFNFTIYSLITDIFQVQSIGVDTHKRIFLGTHNGHIYQIDDPVNVYAKKTLIFQGGKKIQ